MLSLALLSWSKWWRILFPNLRISFRATSTCWKGFFQTCRQKINARVRNWEVLVPPRIHTELLDRFANCLYPVDGVLLFRIEQNHIGLLLLLHFRKDLTIAPCTSSNLIQQSVRIGIRQIYLTRLAITPRSRFHRPERCVHCCRHRWLFELPCLEFISTLTTFLTLGRFLLGFLSREVPSFRRLWH